MILYYAKIAAILMTVTAILFAIDVTVGVIISVIFYGGIGISFLSKLTESPVGYRTNPKNTPEKIRREAMLNELEFMQAEFNSEMRKQK